jgi:hypothetical protein
VRRRRSRAVRSSDARVVLRSAPAESDPGVANGVALHLVDGHLGGVAVDKLDKAAALSGGNLDVGDLAESLEERAELVLRHISREAADEHGGVVGIRELVHLGGRVEVTTSSSSTATAVGERLHSSPHLLLRHATTHHGAALVSVTEAVVSTVIENSHVRCRSSRVDSIGRGDGRNTVRKCA